MAVKNGQAVADQDRQSVDVTGLRVDKIRQLGRQAVQTHAGAIAATCDALRTHQTEVVIVGQYAVPADAYRQIRLSWWSQGWEQGWSDGLAASVELAEAERADAAEK